jgi:hypothetical protein
VSKSFAAGTPRTSVLMRSLLSRGAARLSKRLPRFLVETSRDFSDHTAPHNSEARKAVPETMNPSHSPLEPPDEGSSSPVTVGTRTRVHHHRSSPDACSCHASCAIRWKTSSLPSRFRDRGHRMPSGRPAIRHIRGGQLRGGETESLDRGATTASLRWLGDLCPPNMRYRQVWPRYDGE